MRSVGGCVKTALKGGLASLLLAPCGDSRVHVAADVVGARRSLLLAQLPVCGPHVVLDADHAAGRSSRRHGASVADRAMPIHPEASNRVADVLRVTIHPGVVWRRAKAAPDPRKKPP